MAIENEKSNFKENLSSDDVFVGLLDHGLFADKIPPCFTSKGLAALISQKIEPEFNNADERKLKKLADKYSHDYMRYESLRDSNIPRHLGIPHPEAYAIQSLAIKKHWQTIITHCNHPQLTFSRIYVRRTRSDKIFEMNYKSYEHYQQEELEQSWMLDAHFLVKADISNCFPSIYTHSIPWALHDISEAKKNRRLELAGNLLDKCTQCTRDQQTNGLLIGPHSSNIISEIILTKIDSQLQKKYSKVTRHIDDYCFYAKSFNEAEQFIKDLGLELRAYEMSLNEKKTKILSLPRPSEEDWILVLKRHPLPIDGKLKFKDIRSFIDRALSCAHAIDKSTPLNYAIKVLSKTYISEVEAPRHRELNPRAKRMYAQKSINLALSYPYLASILDKNVFIPYWHDGLENKIIRFATSMVCLGLQKIYPDAIAHAIFLALKYNFKLEIDTDELKKIIFLDDCIVNVLLLKYSIINNNEEIRKTIIEKANNLKKSEKREHDKNWLLIYEVWSNSDLQGNGQHLLAYLKEKDFQFFSNPCCATDVG
ncbi:RNA-directed DNA polymerase [Zymobacter sp. IVIA_12111.31 C1]|uniref:RNA-directed DNA polymerase n=1 Tax=Zymobacter sp. IVIA_12111.31 C1 TaxID=3394854 RepID=UPI0039C007B8